MPGVMVSNSGPARAGVAVNWEACLRRLSAGQRALGLRIGPAARAAMIGYLRHLESWNHSYNLTAVRRPEDMVVKHLLDSLAVLPFVTGTRIADVGSGAGLPGIPIALARPGKRLTLVEANGKKAAFLRHVVRTLSLDNIEIVADRVEKYRPDQGYQTVICRAFAAAPEALRRCGHLCAPKGRVVLMKGRDPSAELAGLPSGFRVAAVAPVAVPGLDAERHVAIIEPGLL